MRGYPTTWETPFFEELVMAKMNSQVIILQICREGWYCSSSRWSPHAHVGPQVLSYWSWRSGLFFWFSLGIRLLLPLNANHPLNPLKNCCLALQLLFLSLKNETKTERKPGHLQEKEAMKGKKNGKEPAPLRPLFFTCLFSSFWRSKPPC